MWNRKEIKQKARRDIKKHLLRAVAVCFIAALPGGESTNILFSYDETNPKRKKTCKSRFNLPFKTWFLLFVTY